VKGTLRDPKDSIAHHNSQISMAGLAMFMMLGQSHGGNRALGDTMTDFFYQGLGATANTIERQINLGTVKRLVDYNFAGIENYPRVTCQKILTVKFEAMVEALQKLASSGVIEPDDDLESDIREQMGLPEKNPDTARVPVTVAMPGTEPGGDGQADGEGAPGAAAARGKRAPGGKAADGQKRAGAPAAGGADGAAADGAKSEKTAPLWDGGVAPGNKSMMSAVTRSGLRISFLDTGSVHVDGSMGEDAPRAKTRREPGVAPAGKSFTAAQARAEKSIAFSAVVSRLDQGRDTVAAALRAARARVQKEVVNKLVNAPVRNLHRVSIAADQKLTDQVEALLQDVYQFGLDQVAAELARQKGGAAPGDAEKIRMADSRRDPIGLYADGIVTEFQNNLTARAATVASDYLRRPGDKTKGEIIQSIENDLDGQSDKWIDGAASKGVNEAFADGRDDGYEAHKDEIGSVIYAAILDINTCEACADADGEEGATPDDIPGAPNPDCDGGDRCRCVHVYVFSDEGSGA
jgi:hypothetical protein